MLLVIRSIRLLHVCVCVCVRVRVCAALCMTVRPKKVMGMQDFIKIISYGGWNLVGDCHMLEVSIQ